MAQASYRSKIRMATIVALSAAIAAGILAGRVARAGQPGEHFWIVFPLLLVICLAAFAGSIPWWRRLDDLQKNGHLLTWYWGGTIGLAVALMALIASTGVESPLTKGAMYLIMGQVGGFLLAFLIWWLRGRGPQE